MPFRDVTIRYLELTGRDQFRPRRATVDGLLFARVDPPMPSLNRFFYMTIGGEWFWLERRPWTLAQWTQWSCRPEVETHIFSTNGLPAGYCELEQLGAGDVEIKYFGLLAEFTGHGLGAHLLTESVECAWERGASRVLLNTCNLDHPRALQNYLARGFREYRMEVQRKEVPLIAPGPWDGAIQA